MLLYIIGYDPNLKVNSTMIATPAPHLPVSPIESILVEGD